MADAVIYARYSDDKQRDESIEDQVRVCREAAERAGDRIRKVYADRAVSGTAAIQRREFLRMVADAQQGGFSKVYVYKTDRFARNRYDAAIYRRKLREAGVSIEPVAEHIPEGPEGIILEALMEGMAEYYSANLSQQVKRGMEGNALRCHHNGVRVQGYRCMPDGSYEVDEEQAAVVRRIFGMYAGGMTFAEMADALNAEGLRTPQGRRYCKQTFGPILRNERYIGVYRWGSVRREGGMPAIVDPVLWADVQARLTGIRPHVYGRGELYGLTGRLFDADGNVYRGYSAHGWGGRKYSYYQCVATGDLVRKDALEEAVNRAAADLLCSDEGLGAGIVDAILAEQERLMGGEVESIRSMERRLSGIDGKISNLVDLAAEMGDARRVAAKIRALEDEKAALAEWFPQCDKISIDYAVMEKSEDIHVIASDLGWSDLGTWGSVREHLPKDPEGNSAVGADVRLFGCRNCVVHAGGARTVVAEGLDGYIVSEADGNILVCRLSEEQHIREYSQKKPD